MYIVKRLLTEAYSIKHKHQLNDAISLQQKAFKHILEKSKHTAFGRDHKLDTIDHYDAYRNRFSLKNYEDYRPYVDKALKGESNQIWPDLPKYFLYTSATTSERKLIPVTRDSFSCQITSVQKLYYSLVVETQRLDLLKRDIFALGGTPELTQEGNAILGRASGVMRRHVPKVFFKNLYPSYETQLIADVPTMLHTAAKEIIGKNLAIVTGFPTWLQLFMKACLEVHNAENMQQLFPELKIALVYGVNYRPYEELLNQLLGRPFVYRELYGASEGTISYQDTQDKDAGMLLDSAGGIFFEFIPASRMHETNPERLPLWEVQLGVTYAVVITTPYGFYSYLLGDTIEFVSINPFRIKVVGRTKHFINRVGEHLNAAQVEAAITKVNQLLPTGVKEFTVAPSPIEQAVLYHEWFVDCDASIPLDWMANAIDDALMATSHNYGLLRRDHSINMPKVSRIPPSAFASIYASRDNLDTQHKLPRLMNDRSLANKLSPYIEASSIVAVETPVTIDA